MKTSSQVKKLKLWLMISQHFKFCFLTVLPLRPGTYRLLRLGARCSGDPVLSVNMYDSYFYMWTVFLNKVRNAINNKSLNIHVKPHICIKSQNREIWLFIAQCVFGGGGGHRRMSLGGQSWEDYSFVIIVKTLGLYQAEKFGICCCTVCFFIDFNSGLTQIESLGDEVGICNWICLNLRQVCENPRSLSSPKTEKL